MAGLVSTRIAAVLPIQADDLDATLEKPHRPRGGLWDMGQNLV